jgi:L-seryl-tRNA(Ser) seleniumtransferase
MSEAPSSDPDLDDETHRLYEDLGARPVINAAGALTILGGSRLSPGVLAAMDAANRSYADMRSLLESSGRIVAELLDAEAAYITSGGAASLALSMAACLTLDHPEYLDRLPDTQGIPNTVLVQRNSRQKYDECLRFAGARIVAVGDAAGLTAQQLAAAIGPNTAAVHYFAQSRSPGTPSIDAVVEVAHAAGKPVIVDAAGLTYPIDNLRRFTRAGADLVCYAAKYFDGPHSTGLIVGRKDLVEVAAVNGFVGFETSGSYTIGRAMKVDRQEIFACVAALREWLALDHEARLSRYAADANVILAGLRGVLGVEASLISDVDEPSASTREGVRIVLQAGFAKSAEDVFAALRDGEPSIWVRTDHNRVNVSVGFLNEGEAEVVAGRLREVLGA